MGVIHNSGTPQDHWVNSHSYALLIMSFAGIILWSFGVILPSGQAISSISHYSQVEIHVNELSVGTHAMHHLISWKFPAIVVS